MNNELLNNFNYRLFVFLYCNFLRGLFSILNLRFVNFLLTFNRNIVNFIKNTIFYIFFLTSLRIYDSSISEKNVTNRILHLDN